MARRSPNELRVHDRVVTTTDLGAVPAGTQGKIILRNSADGQRYRFRVWFDLGGPNGTDVGHLSADVLQRVDRKGNTK